MAKRSLFLIWALLSRFLITVHPIFDLQSIISASEPNYSMLGHRLRIRERRSSSYRRTQNMLVYSEPLNEHMKEVITEEHNRLRRIVPATDMRMMYWSDELAISAQRHANRCDFRHSNDRVNVGENIWAAPYSNYTEAVARWFNEVYDARCDCNHAYKHCCGHYVQVVWSETNLVGCGYARCRDIWGVLGRGHRHVFVCHYNPQGNTVYVTRNGFFAMPAFTWADDKPRCNDCPPDAPACYHGLCYRPNDFQSQHTDPDLDSNNLAQNQI